MAKESKGPKYRVIHDHNYFWVQPRQIDTKGKTGIGNFGKSEVEEAALHILHFFKSKGKWCGFTIPEMVDFFRQHGISTDKMFFGLLGAWFDDGMAIYDYRYPDVPYFAQDETGKFHPTDHFIRKCYGK